MEGVTACALSSILCAMHSSCLSFELWNLCTCLRYSPNTMMPVAGIRSVFAKRHDSAVSVLRCHSNRQAGGQLGGVEGRSEAKAFRGQQEITQS